MKTILSSFIALSLLMGASTAFARSKSEHPKSHTKKKHSKSGKNHGESSHKSSDNVPTSN
jgi:hypothetical protein